MHAQYRGEDKVEFIAYSPGYFELSKYSSICHLNGHQRQSCQFCQWTRLAKNPKVYMPAIIQSQVRVLEHSYWVALTHIWVIVNLRQTVPGTLQGNRFWVCQTDTESHGRAKTSYSSSWHITHFSTGTLDIEQISTNHYVLARVL